jgi:hypothetical protein
MVTIWKTKIVIRRDQKNVLFSDISMAIEEFKPAVETFLPFIEQNFSQRAAAARPVEQFNARNFLINVDDVLHKKVDMAMRVKSKEKDKPRIDKNVAKKEIETEYGGHEQKLRSSRGQTETEALSKIAKRYAPKTKPESEEAIEEAKPAKQLSEEETALKKIRDEEATGLLEIQNAKKAAMLNAHDYLLVQRSINVIGEALAR